MKITKAELIEFVSQVKAIFRERLNLESDVDLDEDFTLNGVTLSYLLINDVYVSDKKIVIKCEKGESICLSIKTDIKNFDVRNHLKTMLGKLQVPAQTGNEV